MKRLLTVAAIMLLAVTATACKPSKATETRSRATLDYIVAAKATAEGFGMTPQQYYAYETAAIKAGFTADQWHSTMTLFSRRMSDLKRRGNSYLWNQLYSQGAGIWLETASAGSTTTMQALELSLNAIQKLKANTGASIAAQFSDEIGLGPAGVVLKREDVEAEMPRFQHLTDDFFAAAKKERDALIDARR